MCLFLSTLQTLVFFVHFLLSFLPYSLFFGKYTSSLATLTSDTSAEGGNMYAKVTTVVKQIIPTPLRCRYCH